MKSAGPFEHALAALGANLALLLGLAFALRVLLAAVLWFAFGQREFTDDVQFHLQLASDPLYYLLCRHAEWSQQPPLLGLMETTLRAPTAMFGAYFGVRIAYSVWDLAGSLILIRALAYRGWDAGGLRLLLLFGPLNVYASAVSAQDETITWCFACIVGACLLRARPGRAFLVACAGIVAAKILFVPIAAALVPQLMNRKGLAWLALGATLVAALYTRGALCHYEVHRFVLAAVHTVSAWQWLVPALDLEWVSALRLSALAVLGLGLPLLALSALRAENPGRPDPLRSSLVALFAFLGVFYHVVPEYVLVTVPLLLLHAKDLRWTDTRIVIALGLLAALPIVPDVLRFFVRHGHGGEWLVVLHRAACVAVSLVCVFLAIAIALRREQAEVLRT